MFASFIFGSAVLPEIKPLLVDFLGSLTPELNQKSGSLNSSPVNSIQPEQLSPLALAYIGDAVYELYVRSQLLLPPKRISQYHSQVVNRVRAETQAAYLCAIEADLTPEEKDIVRRGRNAVSHKPKRLSPKVYQQATSLEALIGYLYLTDRSRLQELLAQSHLHTEPNA